LEEVDENEEILEECKDRGPSALGKASDEDEDEEIDTS